VKWHIVVGSIAVVGALVVGGIMAIGEQDRMTTFTQSYRSRQVEEGALIFENNCRTCHGIQGKGTPLGPAINDPALFNGERLSAVSFNGTVEDYLTGTISAGRPVPSQGAEAYPQRMPTWSQEFGGPLRIDQVESVVTFIMNWEDRAVAGGEPPPTDGELMMGSEIGVPLPEGNADAGQALAEGTLGCAACHILTVVGPPWTADGGLPALGTRAEIRIGQDDYAGEATTGEEYLVESVVMTNAYVVEGYAAGLMPADFGEKLTLQDMADLLAYMMTFR
jgi:mono/diheme cytochrome c family protein